MCSQCFIQFNSFGKYRCAWCVGEQHMRANPHADAHRQRDAHRHRNADSIGLPNLTLEGRPKSMQTPRSRPSWASPAKTKFGRRTAQLLSFRPNF